MQLASGQRLGHYDIVAPIGAGGMGAVYRAHDTVLRRTVAIKVLHDDLAGEARGKLLREARAASALSHPHICSVHNVEEAEGFAFIVMEHVSGRPLQTLAGRALLPSQVQRYGMQIARALEHAHAHGIVHRDLKSANIMVTDDDDVVVLDFGIASHTGEQHGRGLTSTLADAGDRAGTVAYMAPERLRGSPGDVRSDIWSLGIVLYEMAAGAMPFVGETPFAVSAAILEQPARPLSESVPAPLQRAIDRCLQKDPGRRYQTAAEAAAALDAGETTPRRGARWGTGRWALALAGVVIAALLAFVAVTRWERVPTPAATTVQRVAILPLNVIGGTAEESHLGVGIADAIITRLAAVRRIALRPTTAVLPYASQSPDVAAVGAALAVDQVIVGTIQPTETTYRVSLQMVRAADRGVSWAHTLDTSRGDLLALQDRVAEQIVTALSLQLSGDERARLSRRYTDNTAAYAVYLKGRSLLVNYTEANMREAVSSFEQALAIDTEYALARSALATACAWFSVRYAYGPGAIEWGQRAEREARAALASDATLADAHVALANAAGTAYRGFDWRTLLDESERALALDPAAELAFAARMRAFYHLGQFERVADEARRVRSLNPAYNAEVARLEVAAKLFNGEFDKARDRAVELLARNDAPVVRQYLALARYYLGEVAAAREMLASNRQSGEPDVRSQASLASIEAAVGEKAAARQRAQSVARGSYMDHHVAYSLGAAWAQLGEHTAAMKWLQQAAETGFPCDPWFRKDPLLDPLRSDPAFARLLASVAEHARLP